MLSPMTVLNVPNQGLKVPWPFPNVNESYLQEFTKECRLFLDTLLVTLPLRILLPFWLRGLHLLKFESPTPVRGAWLKSSLSFSSLS